MIWLPSSASSPERTSTAIPVCFSNAATSAAVVCSCWPLYSVIVLPPCADEPHALSASATHASEGTENGGLATAHLSKSELCGRDDGRTVAQGIRVA